MRTCSFKLSSRGQAIAELALVLPLVTFVVLGAVQIGLLIYGAGAARFSAFAGARAAAVAAPLGRADAARNAVRETTSMFPGIEFVAAVAGRTPLPLRGPGIDAGQARISITVRVSVPRLLPLPYASTATATCAMPMEPVF